MLKRKMKLLVVLISLSLLFSGCFRSRNNYYYQGMQFDEKTGKIIAEKFDLDPKGNFDINNFPTEAEIKSQKIHEFYLSFSSKKRFNVAESRRLIVDCVEIIIKNANKDKKIRKYLANYPVTSKNITLVISFYDDTSEERMMRWGSERRTDGSIADCYLCENIIHYTIVNKELFSEDKYNETYEEALKIVQEEKTQSK